MLRRFVLIGISNMVLLTHSQNFGTGFYEGLTDIVTKPRDGAKKEGALGFMKGVGKGSLNMVTKPGSGE